MTLTEEQIIADIEADSKRWELIQPKKISRNHPVRTVLQVGVSSPSIPPVSKICVSKKEAAQSGYVIAFSGAIPKKNDKGFAEFKHQHRKRTVNFLAKKDEMGELRPGKIAHFSTCEKFTCPLVDCRERVVQKTARRIYNFIYQKSKTEGLFLYHVVASTTRKMKPQTLRAKVIKILKSKLIYGVIANHGDTEVNHCHIILAAHDDFVISNCSKEIYENTKIIFTVTGAKGKMRLTVKWFWNCSRYILRKAVIGYKKKPMRSYRIF